MRFTGKWLRDDEIFEESQYLLRKVFVYTILIARLQAIVSDVLTLSVFSVTNMYISNSLFDLFRIVSPRRPTTYNFISGFAAWDRFTGIPTVQGKNL